MDYLAGALWLAYHYLHAERSALDIVFLESLFLFPIMKRAIIIKFNNSIVHCCLVETQVSSNVPFRVSSKKSNYVYLSNVCERSVYDHCMNVEMTENNSININIETILTVVEK